MSQRVRTIRTFMIVLFLLILFMVPSVPAFGSDTGPSDALPVPVKMGVFVMSIYDLSLVDKSFNTVFWVWFVFPKDSPIRYMPEETVGVMGAKSFERLFDFDEVKGSQRWATAKFNAVIIHDWEMDDFPFDRQLLTIELEEAELDATNVIFVPDKKNSGIDTKVKIPGWRIDGFSIESRLIIDETT